MNLYLVTAKYKIGAVDGSILVPEVSEFVGSQAEAATLRASHVKGGVARKDITTTAVNVPTDKEGLLRFLNLMATSPTVAVAAEKLIA